MALTYTYVNSLNLIREIGENDLNYAGYWSSGSSYFFGDVVLYNDTRYLALLASEGSAPPTTTVNDANWSVLVLAVTGTDTGSYATDAYTLANEAYGIATYAVSIAGTAGGSGDATYAYNVARTALDTAWAGTSGYHEAYHIGRAALDTAWVGTNLADIAYGLATYAIALTGTAGGGPGTSDLSVPMALGKAALETAWAGTSAARAAHAVAKTALETSWVGTESGHQANLTGAVAHALAVEGTNAAVAARAVAQTALETAWTGTRLDTLSDVLITSPTAAQNLAYDGSKWINSDPTSVVAPTAYTGYYDDAPSGVSDFNSFTTLPTGIPEVVDTVNVGGATRGVFIEAYVTGTLARTYLSPGIWEFNHYLSVDNASRPAVMAWDVFVRTAAGAESFWFSGTSSSISTTTVLHDSILMVQDAKSVSADDRILVRLWAYRNSPNAVNLSFYHNGGTHNSHIHTPFGVAHNDLAGLQGGQTGEYYHLTADQAAAALGSSGSPSASNKFVTQNDSVLANGAEARRFASGAYDLAVIGTNAASTAQQAADSAQQQIATISTIILVAQSGTYNTFVAQVPNWKSDVPVTVTNGVVTAVGVSRYNYQDFRNEPIGLAGTAIGQLATGFTWTGTAIIQSGISNAYDTGVFPHNPIYRMPADEFDGSGTLGRDELYLNRGTGWAAPWIIQESYAIMGTEAFEDYDIGPFVPINGTGGYGWTGTTAIN